MLRTTLSALSGLTLSLALLAGALLSAPEPLEASDCGDNSGNVCEQTESCVGIWFWKSCTTTFKYYKEQFLLPSGG